MSLDAGRLRHRLLFQSPVYTQDQDTGDMVKTWEDYNTFWGAIEPLSARDLIAAQQESSRVSARIVVRYNPNVKDNMRIYHAAKDQFYNIEGILYDKESGLEYMTIPVSEGLKYQEGDV